MEKKLLRLTIDVKGNGNVNYGSLLLPLGKILNLRMNESPNSIIFIYICNIETYHYHYAISGYISNDLLSFLRTQVM
jgi:hypothetical protein